MVLVTHTAFCFLTAGLLALEVAEHRMTGLATMANMVLRSGGGGAGGGVLE